MVCRLNKNYFELKVYPCEILKRRCLDILQISTFRFHAALFSFSSKNINLLIYSTHIISSLSVLRVQTLHKFTRALRDRINDNEKRTSLFSRWYNFTYFTRYCLTQCVSFMFNCWLLFNRRIRHLHLLRCAWALSIKRLLCVIEKKLNACKNSHCNRNIGNAVPWKSRVLER